MPTYASHLLQPLDVGCFRPQKKAYRRQIESLVRNHIHHITKLEFLPAFKAAFYNLITKDNICASFQGTGLVQFNPEAVLLRLDVKLRTHLLLLQRLPNDKDSLEQIANVVEGLDSLLYKTIKGQVTEVRLGDEYSADWNKGAIGTHHHYSDIVVTGKALLGNKYGGKDFWDD